MHVVGVVGSSGDGEVEGSKERVDVVIGEGVLARCRQRRETKAVRSGEERETVNEAEEKFTHSEDESRDVRDLVEKVEREEFVFVLPLCRNGLPRR